MNQKFRTVAIVFIIFISGCDDSFSPNVDLVRKVVVFGVLTPNANSQFIRVHSIASPQESNPRNDSVAGTVVRVSKGGSMTAFRDTLLVAVNDVGDTVKIPAFVTYELSIERGARYALSVASPSYGEVSAIVSVPSRGVLSTLGNLILEDPWDQNEDLDIIVSIALSPDTKGFFMRFFLNYDVFRNGAWTTENVEVPIKLEDSNGLADIKGVYPSLGLRTTSRSPTGFPVERKGYMNSEYRKVLTLIYATYGSQNIRMKKAVFQMIQVEDNLFNYYFIANNFADKFSIRVDQPEFTNINGGFGVFGAFTFDSLVVDLPADLSPRPPR